MNVDDAMFNDSTSFSYDFFFLRTHMTYLKSIGIYIIIY